LKYFLLDINENCTKSPRILYKFNTIKRRDVTLSNHKNIDRRTLLYVQSSPDTIFTDIMTTPFLMFSEKLFKITKQYVPNLVTKQIILLDEGNSEVNVYYLIILPKVDCISESSELNKTRSEFIKPVITASKIPPLDIFTLKNFDSVKPVISLNLAESILRREPRGIHLTEVHLV